MPEVQAATAKLNTDPVPGSGGSNCNFSAHSDLLIRVSTSGMLDSVINQRFELLSQIRVSLLSRPSPGKDRIKTCLNLAGFPQFRV